MSDLLVNEVFETIQGEGFFTGTPSIFIRLQGCPVGCSWCDTKHTWSVKEENQVSADTILVKNGDDSRYFSTSSDKLLSLISNQGYSARHIVITGGEPCMFDLRKFTYLAAEQGFSVQIETSGTFEILCDERIWVTVSPKINMQGGYKVLNSSMQRADEIKHAVAMQKHVDELDKLIQYSTLDSCLTNEQKTLKKPMIYLQPISQQARATEFAVKTCIERNWNLSVQLHKYIGVE